MLQLTWISDEDFELLKNIDGLKSLVSDLLNTNENKCLLYDKIFLFIFIRFLSTVYIGNMVLLSDFIEENKTNDILDYKNIHDIYRKKLFWIGIFEYLDILWVFNKILLNIINYKKNKEDIKKALSVKSEEELEEAYIYLSKNSDNYKKLAYLYNIWLMLKWQEYKQDGWKLEDYINFIDINLFKEFPWILLFVDIKNINEYKKFVSRSWLSNIEKAFAIQYGFINRENDIIKKLLFIYENTELNIEKLQKLDDKQVSIISENYKLSLEFLERIINGEDIENIKKDFRIEEFKKEINKKLALIPQTKWFKTIVENIQTKLDNLNSENFDSTLKEVNKLFNNNLSKIFKKIDGFLKLNVLSLTEIQKVFQLLDNKKTKKNKIDNNKILEILDYLLMNYDKEEILFITDVIENRVVTNAFVDSYKDYISLFVKNQNIIEQIVSKNDTLQSLYKKVKSDVTEQNINDMINMYFPEELKNEIYEFYKKNSEDFNKLVTISKKLDNKKDEYFYLELITLDNQDFIRFYFIVKNLSNLWVNINKKWGELLRLVNDNYFTEEKLKELKNILKWKLIDDLDEWFFYTLFLEYVYGQETIDIFEFFIKKNEEEIENKVKSKKNKSLKGLADINGETTLRIFKKLWYTLKKQTGSHCKMIKWNSILIFPYHNPIKASTLLGILNRAWIKKEDFLAQK